MCLWKFDSLVRSLEIWVTAHQKFQPSNILGKHLVLEIHIEPGYAKQIRAH